MLLDFERLCGISTSRYSTNSALLRLTCPVSMISKIGTERRLSGQIFRLCEGRSPPARRSEPRLRRLGRRSPRRSGGIDPPRPTTGIPTRSSSGSTASGIGCGAREANSKVEGHPRSVATRHRSRRTRPAQVFQAIRPAAGDDDRHVRILPDRDGETRPRCGASPVEGEQQRRPKHCTGIPADARRSSAGSRHRDRFSGSCRSMIRPLPFSARAVTVSRHIRIATRAL